MESRTKVISTLIALILVIIFLFVRDYQYHENITERSHTNKTIDSLKEALAFKDVKTKYAKSDGWELISQKDGCKLYFKRMVIKEEGLASNTYYHAFWSICENGGTSITIK